MTCYIFKVAFLVYDKLPQNNAFYTISEYKLFKRFVSRRSQTKNCYPCTTVPTGYISFNFVYSS